MTRDSKIPLIAACRMPIARYGHLPQLTEYDQSKTYRQNAYMGEFYRQTITVDILARVGKVRPQ